MVETATYEVMVDRKITRNKTETPVWDLFWTHIAMTDDPTV